MFPGWLLSLSNSKYALGSSVSLHGLIVLSFFKFLIYFFVDRSEMHIKFTIVGALGGSVD